VRNPQYVRLPLPRSFQQQTQTVSTASHCHQPLALPASEPDCPPGQPTGPTRLSYSKRLLADRKADQYQFCQPGLTTGPAHRTHSASPLLPDQIAEPPHTRLMRWQRGNGL
jgi:hypothetical protein